MHPVPLTRAQLRRLFSADLVNFASLLQEITDAQALCLASKIEPPTCLCKPACRPPEWIEDRDPRSETFGFKVVEHGYAPCPAARYARGPQLDYTRQALIAERAYGRAYTGPEKEAAPAPAVLTDAGRVAVLSERHRAGSKLSRPDDPWLASNRPRSITVKADTNRSKEELVYADPERRSLLAEIEAEVQQELEAGDLFFDSEEEPFATNDRLRFLQERWFTLHEKKEEVAL